MKKSLFSFYILCLWSVLNVSAQETFKVMFYNLLNYPLETAVANREQDLEFILSDYQPDLFLVCELNNIAGAINVLDITKSAVNSNYEMATFVYNTSDDNIGDYNYLQNLLYYDSTKFILEEEIIVQTYLRDFNVYKLQLNTIDQTINPIEVYVIVCHLKASSGDINAQRRFEMVEDLEDYLETLPTDSNVLLGGDLNLYSANEAAFQNLLSNSNPITFNDLSNRIGDWHNNTSYIDVFSQSTRTQSGFGGATGGFDDRFDFILASENMVSTSNITYIPNSYQVYGNNGLVSCYNRAINSSDCETTGSQFSFEIRDALHNFSDHLPVTVSLEIDATLLNLNAIEASIPFTLKQNVIHNILTIYIDSFQLINEDIIIYNSLGQRVKTLSINSDNEQQFDVSDLQNGLYLLVSPKQHIKPLKFIISH